MQFHQPTVICVLLVVALNTNFASAQRYQSFRPSFDRQVSRPAYRLDAGDMLAIIIEGVIGDFDSAQVYLPTDKQKEILPSVGFPFVILDDGTLALPLIDPINVRGMTVTQAKRAIVKAYVEQDILKKADNASIVLLRKRTVNVTVLHDRARRGYGVPVKLPADRADVLTALVEGGPFDANGDVRVIGRGSRRNGVKEGDIVHVRSQRPAYFYVGGLTNGGQYRLPVDRTLNPTSSHRVGWRDQAVTDPLARRRIVCPVRARIV